MLEIPEANVLARQINDTLTGKKIGKLSGRQHLLL